MLRWNGPSVPLARRGWSRSCFFWIAKISPEFHETSVMLNLAKYKICYTMLENPWLIPTSFTYILEFEPTLWVWRGFRSHENHNWTLRESWMLRCVEWGETTQNKITWTCLSLKIRGLAKRYILFEILTPPKKHDMFRFGFVWGLWKMLASMEHKSEAGVAKRYLGRSGCFPKVFCFLGLVLVGDGCVGFFLCQEFKRKLSFCIILMIFWKKKNVSWFSQLCLRCVLKLVFFGKVALQKSQAGKRWPRL